MPHMLHNGPSPLLLWTLFLACILMLVTTNAARMEVLNLDRSSEDEKERSKDGTCALMAMAIGQAKKELAVCNKEIARLVEQGPATNQPVDGSESLVQVDESQGRRGAMAGCISQGGSGCNTAFTIASGNRAGNSERALAEAAATVTRKAGEGDLAEIKIIETEQDKKLAPSATDHTATLDGQQYTSELQSMKKTEETVEGAETLMESTAPNSTAPTTVAAPTSALCADTETATTCGLAKQLCNIKEGQGMKDYYTTKLLRFCRQALGLCGATPSTTKNAEIVANATSTKTEIQSPTATTKNIAICDGDQGGSLPCSRLEPLGGKAKHQPSACPDDLSKGKFFFQHGHDGKGYCVPLSHKSAIRRQSAITHKFPGLEDKYVVLTKPGIQHPHKSHPKVVGLFLKRMVCTVDFPITCRTYKTGICAKCHDVAFKSKLANRAWPENFRGKTALAERFVDECFLKKAYDECKGKDLKYFSLHWRLQ